MTFMLKFQIACVAIQLIANLITIRMILRTRKILKAMQEPQETC